MHNPHLLTAADLIARMTPTALAETIASIRQCGCLDKNEMATLTALEIELWNNVGVEEADELIATASR
jgi:hypothetical protein